MEENKLYYKSSGSFSVLGLILLILSVIVVGCLLSAAYLKLNQVCTIVYLCVIAACAFGGIMGVIANFFIKVYKIRNPLIAVTGIVIACLFVTYFKWGLYCYWDNQKYYYDSADDQYSSAYAFLTDELWLDDEELESAFGDKLSLSELKELSISDLIYVSDYGFYEMMTNEELPAYLEKRSLPKVLLQPGVMLEQIKDINEEGRWSYSSRPRYSSSYSTESSAVTGALLWIVWLAEGILIVAFPIVMGKNRSKKPFIEYENDWAEEYDNKMLGFGNFNITKNIRQQIETQPEYLFNYGKAEGTGSRSDYVVAKLYHSRDYSETYMSLVKMTYVPKNRNYSQKEVMKYLRVDFDFVEKLFDFCNISKPFPETHKYFADGAPVVGATRLDSTAGMQSNPISQPNYEDVFK